MKIRKCIKGFNNGMRKVIPPEKTFEIALQRIWGMKEPILKWYSEFHRPSEIPQTCFHGTDNFRKYGTTMQNGKGHIQSQAKASGIMELVERYSCKKYLLDNKVYKVKSFNELDNKLFSSEFFYSNCINKDKVAVLLDEELKNAKIRWYPGFSLDGKSVYLPMALIINLCECSNGMAAGNSFEEALLQGICEVIERHCMTLIAVDKINTPSIDLSTINYPIAQQMIKSFLSLGNEVHIKDFSQGLELPVIGVIRKVSESKCVVTCGVATSTEEALIRALTESSQSEGCTATTHAITDSKHHFYSARVIPINVIPSIDNGDIKIELKKIQQILRKRNMNIFYLNTTDVELKIPSVIVFISNTKYFDQEIAFRNILTTLVLEFMRTNNLKDAEKYITRGLQDDVLNYLVYLYYKGGLLMEKKNYIGAIKCFSEVYENIERDFYKRSSLNLICRCYLKSGDIINALCFYIKATNVYREKSEFNEYEKFYFNKLISSLLNIVRLLHGGMSVEEILAKINISTILPKLDGIEGLFREYKERKSNYNEIIQCSLNHYHMKQYEKAIVEIKKAIDLIPEEIDAYMFLVNYYEETEKFDDALSTLKETSSLFPFEAINYVNLAKIHLNLKNYEKALKEAEKAINLGYPKGDMHLLLGVCYEKEKQYLKAINELKKAKKENPYEPQINFSLSNSYKHVGQMEYAYKELDEGIIKLKKTNTNLNKKIIKKCHY